MRTQILSAVLVGLALFTPVGALAQTTSTASTTRDAHRAELQTKLAKIRDANKVRLVEKIDGSVADLNKRTTDHYLNVLDQINSVLTRVIAKTDKVQTEGKDVAVVRAKITLAQTAIASAKTKVQAQAAKTYTINVTTDATLKRAVQTVRKALHDDLVLVRDAVRAAHEAVKQAIVALANLAGESTSTAVTSSTNQ